MSRLDAKGLVTMSLDMSAVEIIRARRSCTVPQQLLKSRELPKLPNTRAVPRRYEETKPVQVQNFTHQRIIDLGELINRQSKDESVKVRQDAIEKAVADAWEAAQEIKVKAVKDAVEKAQVQHEKQLRRVARQHDRALKEEALKVESMMQNKMREMLEAEKVQAAAELEAAVQQVKEQCAVELQEAVAAARKEEQDISDSNRVQLLNEAAHTLQVTKDQLAEREKQSLAELEKKKEEEKLVAVRETETKERENKADALNDLKQHHLAEIKQLEDNINDLHVALKEREQFVVRVQHKREQLYDELLKVQADYQNFIDKHPLFDPGQTGYLLQNVQANPAIINPYTDNPKAEN